VFWPWFYFRKLDPRQEIIYSTQAVFCAEFLFQNPTNIVTTQDRNTVFEKGAFLDPRLEFFDKFLVKNTRLSWPKAIFKAGKPTFRKAPDPL